MAVMNLAYDPEGPDPFPVGRVEGASAVAAALAGHSPMPAEFVLDLDALLAERKKHHGEFAEVARIAQARKAAMRAEPGWVRLSDMQREALDMDASKQARILTGDPNHADHWDDIAGYARLVAERVR